ncbi:Alpha/Beta hydrolase protein [Apiosordaria backusii]|uniref:Alpha/Beta hydrolase protein n=1 Tax=Apiosordaria backusii TaxID=314023 RepID=A0AA40A728_9PEZI|nr:Alpha/Beta hydrolase protein [Apiosordaria backusii]
MKDIPITEATHEYLLSLTDLYSTHNIPLIFYDQIGCGRSTHYRDKIADITFWTIDLFLNELDNLIDCLNLRERGFYLLGQSWGGMLAGVYAACKPRGLKKMIIASAPGSMPGYTIRECETNGDYESVKYKKAMGVWYRRHVCQVEPMPEEVRSVMRRLGEDSTSYLTLQGPSEFTVTGSLKDWEGWKDAHNIEVKTLVLNGKYDEVTDKAIEPWVKHIPKDKVKWIKFEESSHMAHWEERERFMEVCAEFLLNG